jgi:hypothetical protein
MTAPTWTVEPSDDEPSDVEQATLWWRWPGIEATPVDKRDLPRLSAPAWEALVRCVALLPAALDAIRDALDWWDDDTRGGDTEMEALRAVLGDAHSHTGLRCPRCESTDCYCDGRMHHCRSCGYDGTSPPKP